MSSLSLRFQRVFLRSSPRMDAPATTLCSVSASSTAIRRRAAARAALNDALTMTRATTRNEEDAASSSATSTSSSTPTSDSGPSAAAAALAASSSPTSTSSTSSNGDSPSAAAAALAAASFFANDARPVLLYDAKCNLCNGGVDVARALDKKGDAARLRFAALQSPAGRALLFAAAKRDPDDISSVVFVENPKTAFIRSEAVVRAAKTIGAPPALLAAALAGPVPLKARDAAYDSIADNRYSLFGKSEKERWTREGEAEGRFLVE